MTSTDHYDESQTLQREIDMARAYLRFIQESSEKKKRMVSTLAVNSAVVTNAYQEQQKAMLDMQRDLAEWKSRGFFAEMMDSAERLLHQHPHVKNYVSLEETLKTLEELKQMLLMRLASDDGGTPQSKESQPCQPNQTSNNGVDPSDASLTFNTIAKQSAACDTEDSTMLFEYADEADLNNLTGDRIGAKDPSPGVLQESETAMDGDPPLAEVQQPMSSDTEPVKETEAPEDTRSESRQLRSQPMLVSGGPPRQNGNATEPFKTPAVAKRRCFIPSSPFRSPFKTCFDSPTPTFKKQATAFGTPAARGVSKRHDTPTLKHFSARETTFGGSRLPAPSSVAKSQPPVLQSPSSASSTAAPIDSNNSSSGSTFTMQFTPFQSFAGSDLLPDSFSFDENEPSGVSYLKSIFK